MWNDSPECAIHAEVISYRSMILVLALSIGGCTSSPTPHPETDAATPLAEPPIGATGSFDEEEARDDGALDPSSGTAGPGQDGVGEQGAKDSDAGAAGDAVGVEDAGEPSDAGPVDAGPADGGPADAGPVDGATLPDGGRASDGWGSVDAG